MVINSQHIFKTSVFNWRQVYWMLYRLRYRSRNWGNKNNLIPALTGFKLREWERRGDKQIIKIKVYTPFFQQFPPDCLWWLPPPPPHQNHVNEIIHRQVICHSDTEPTILFQVWMSECLRPEQMTIWNNEVSLRHYSSERASSSLEMSTGHAKSILSGGSQGCVFFLNQQPLERIRGINT